MSVFTTLRRNVGLSPQKPKTVLTSNASSSTAASSSKSPTTLDKGPVHGYLVLESSKGAETERFPLQKRITTVGRLHQCDIRVYEDTVSRLHCQICVADDGKISLQAFNVKGLRLNKQKIQSMASASSDGDKIFELQENDLIEMFTHRFRLEYVARDENGKAIVPKNARLGRKSLRMSLVRAAVGEVGKGAPLQESQAALEEVEEDGEKEDQRINPPITEQDKENAEPVKKGRRSYALSTPARESTRNVPWESEPRKKKVKRLSLSPIKGATLLKSSLGSPSDADTSIVVMEEVDDSAEEEEEAQAVDEYEGGGKEPVQDIESSPADEVHTTPARDTAPPLQRLTQSSSPKKPSKKARRRSSFFGRAGIFAGLNLGFYPEERREKEEAKAVDCGLREEVVVSLSPAMSPDKMQKPITPEPRLDSYGMPRLPRSMSSPSGLNYGSPGKRRVISLRTATLIKTGQQTFEQRKLLSPPASPTKTFSSPSLMAPFVSSPSPEKKAAAGQIPLPDSDDEEDADEVDRSLSSFAEDEVEEKPLPPPHFSISKSRTINGPRKSHGVLSTQTADPRTKSKGRGRTSLPGKLLSVSLVESSNEKAVEEWRKEWEEEGAKAGTGKGIEVALNNAFDQAQDEDTDEETELDVEQQERASPLVEAGTSTLIKEARSPLKLLRHMVRDNSEVTALLDQISGDGATQDEQDVDGKENAVLVTTAADEVMEESKPVREIPVELTAAASNKLSRRASEMSEKKMRRRSSIAHKTQSRKARKSAGAVLHNKEEEQVPTQLPSLPSVDAEATCPPSNDVNAFEMIPQQQRETPASFEELKEEKDKAPRPVTPPIQEAAVPKRLPRKRAVEAIQTKIPIAARPERGAKVEASTEASSSTHQPSGTSPQKKITRRAKNATSSGKGHFDEVSSDDLHSSRLILDPSSPVKRTKRAAKEQAETKIRNVLVKKPSIAVMRDARSLSEAGPKASSKPSDEIKARIATRYSQMPSRKASSKEIVQSEPTRTTRSRAAAKR